MRAQPVHKSFDTRRLATLLVSAVALVIGVCIAAMLWMLSVASSSIDATTEDGTRKLVDSVVDTYQNNLSKAVADYAAWDDLYDNFAHHRRAKWEAENIGSNITKTFGVDFVAVASSTGALVYSHHEEEDPQPLSQSDLRAIAQLATAAVKAKPRAGSASISGVIPFEGTAALASASPILNSTLKDGGPRQFVLIEIRDLRDSFLAKLSRDFGLSGLKIVQTDNGELPLFDPLGRPTGLSLAWAPPRQGDVLFNRVLPAILMSGLVLLIVVLLLLSAWWKIIEQVRLNESRALTTQIEATRERAAAAEEMARSKSAFIANMSHELRTPLNAIIGFSEMMDTEVFGPVGIPKYREYISSIHDSGNHLLRVINDILLISKVEAGKFVPHWEEFNCREVLDESLRMISIVAAKRNIEIDSSRLGCALVVRADRQALRQIFLNVLSNAVKFSPDGETIAIECDGVNAEGRLEVRVADRGCGIPENTLAELGKPFVQAEDPYTRNFQGTGLGLAICFRLAEAMNATIAIASKLGEGTTVTVTLSDVVAKAAPQMAASHA